MTSRDGKVSDWLLERLAAGELPAVQAAELRATLEARGEQARLAAIADSNAEILTALPPARVAAEVERRAAARRKALVHRPVFALSLAATCVAGLAVFLLVRQPGGRPAIVQTGGTTGPLLAPEPPEEPGIKGDPSVLIHRRTKGGEELLRDRQVVRRGDTLQLGYVARGKQFGVIASIDARGTFTLHLPETPGPATKLAQGREHHLPRAYELDDSPGFERFVFVTSDKPFTTADVAAAVAGGRPLPATFKVVELTLKKEKP
jgi:hypothetical protein